MPAFPYPARIFLPRDDAPEDRIAAPRAGRRYSFKEQFFSD